LTTESGVAFRAIIYIPPALDDKFWQRSSEGSIDVRLMVKHVFITSDFGEDTLPKWASWVKVVVDGASTLQISFVLHKICSSYPRPFQADDLPLNVSRETLQSTVFLKQLKQAIIKRLIQLFARISEDDSEKYSALIKSYGTVLKLGAVEDSKNSEKLVALTRFYTNHRNETSLDSVSILVVNDG